MKRVEWAEAERRGAKRGRDFHAPNVRVVRNLLLPTPLVVSHTTERSPQTLDGRGLASGRPLETLFKEQNNYLVNHRSFLWGLCFLKLLLPQVFTATAATQHPPPGARYGVRGRVCGAECAGQGVRGGGSGPRYPYDFIDDTNTRLRGHVRGRVRGGEGCSVFSSVPTLSVFQSRDIDGKCAGRVCRMHSRAVGVCGLNRGLS